MKNKQNLTRAGALQRTGVVFAATALLIGTFVAPASAADTATVTVCLTSSTGANIALGALGTSNGAAARWRNAGNTGNGNWVATVSDSATGCRSANVAVGKTIEVQALQTATSSSWKSHTVTAAGPNRVDFYTTKVAVNFPGAVAYGGVAGDTAHWGSSSRELLSNGVDGTWFRATLGGTVLRTPVPWPEATSTGKTKTFTLAAARVLDGAGNGLPGVTMQYNTANNSTLFWVKDAAGNLIKTDANGYIIYPINGAPANITQVASLNNSSERKTAAANSTSVTTFQTARLAVNYDRQVQYRQNSWGTTMHWLTKAGMELFPGEYTVSLEVPDKASQATARYHPTVPLTLTPGVVTKTGAAVRLSDSQNNGLTTGVVSYYRNAAWASAVGTTDGPGGTWAILLDGAPGNIVYSVSYEGAGQQLALQSLVTRSAGYFQTVPATVQLIDSAGNPVSGGAATFYGTDWRTMGTSGDDGKVVKELLPVKHTFGFSTLGSYEQRTINPVSAAPVVFQTGRITSDGGWIDSFYTNAWQTLPADGVELLPSNVTLQPVAGMGSQFTTNAIPGQISDYSLD